MDANTEAQEVCLKVRPGANVSSTIRALSSCDQRRRRSNPPKTSTRIA